MARPLTMASWAYDSNSAWAFSVRGVSETLPWTGSR